MITSTKLLPFTIVDKTNREWQMPTKKLNPLSTLLKSVVTVFSGSCGYDGKNIRVNCNYTRKTVQNELLLP